MGCGMCGPTSAPKRRYKVTLNSGGEPEMFLTLTEARMYAEINGGGVIEHVE